MSHLLTHPGHHAHLHHVPLRPTIALALTVLVANVGLVWFALSLRADPADDAAQIRSVVGQQIEAINDRDAEALQLTYCREQGPVADAILVALGPRTEAGTLRVARITDIQIHRIPPGHRTGGGRSGRSRRARTRSPAGVPDALP